MNPKVSIIIPTYNRAHMLGETLDSIQGQTFGNWECLVVDDGSTDNTKELVETYGKDHPRIHYLHRPANLPKGANSCRNHGLDKSKGEFVQWFDSDDLMHPDKLSIQVAALQGTDFDYCICQTTYLDTPSGKDLGIRNPHLTSDDPLRDFITFKIFWLTGAVLWRKEFLQSAGLSFDQDLQQAQDYDFHMRALACSTHYNTTDQPLMIYKCHGDNMSVSFTDNPEKIWSNARVKEKMLSTYWNVLPEAFRVTKFKELMAQYKLCLRRGYNSRAYAILRMMMQLIPSYDNLVANPGMLRLRMWAVFIPLSLFNKGDSLLKNKHFDGSR